MQTADIVIIGGGVMGLSIAHHLAQAGAGKIILFEKRSLGAGESGKSGAIIRQHYSTPLLVTMARYGVFAFRDFDAYLQGSWPTAAPPSSLGNAARWMNAGCLIIASAADRAAAEGIVRLMQDAGATAEMLADEALRQCVPQALFQPDEIGAWEPEAGYVDPASVLGAWAQSAKRQGVQIETGVEVLEIETERGRASGVVTQSGRIACNSLVLCAGPWAGRIAARAGVPLPLSVVRPQLAFLRQPEDNPGANKTAETDDRNNSVRLPILGDLRGGFYCRPDGGGRTLIGALDTLDDEIITNPDDYTDTISPDFFRWAAARLGERLPAFLRGYGRGGYSGLYTMTPDSHPIIGAAPALPGLYLAVGFSGHGFKLSPAVGRGLSELIRTGKYQTLDLSPLRPTRFLENQPIRSAYAYGLLS